MGAAFVEALPVKKFHGVGPATAAKMQGFGIETGADLKAKSLSFLQQHFGKSGSWYYRTARGIDESPVKPDRPRKSVGAEDTFVADIFELDAARAELMPLIAKVWRHCETNGLRGRTVTLKVKYADFQQITRSQTVISPPASQGEIEAICFALINQLFPIAKGIRLLGVTLSSLVENSDFGAGQLRLAL
jgi:DNA polymerase-4